ncbi:hypothetical protein G3A43_44400 [Paraburkholderia aspalathi]|uniref:hypothetical protein n=1 Tax=Paraburkholderia nemoris TaxID=2793076 RepID=UPI00190B9F13|nr:MULTISPECIES: hypothetical protein [Paraburkholderia]MBK3787190.1 hypothetical protein [Paraburkholderia aspalathi]
MKQILDGGRARSSLAASLASGTASRMTERAGEHRMSLMKRIYFWTVVAAVVILGAVAWIKRDDLAPTTTLSVRIGETWEDVLKGSTFPVVKHSGAPDKGSGMTAVDAPAVVIVFSDPVNGFTLPATKFAQVTWRNRKVATITTSPMLEALPFNDAVALLNRLQADFRKAGWEPAGGSGERMSSWFDTSSAAGLSELRQAGALGFGQGLTRELAVPHKYTMQFQFRCWDYCSFGPNEYTLYRIDVSIGPDH